MTTWIRFIQEFDDVVEIDRVELAFNSRMTGVHQGSNLGRIVDGMIAHMKMQIENPALANSRFRFNAVLFLDVNLDRLNLTRGSSYIPLQDWVVKKKVIINPHNDDEECFKWAIIAASEMRRNSSTCQILESSLIITTGLGWSFLLLSIKLAYSKRKMMFQLTY